MKNLLSMLLVVIGILTGAFNSEVVISAEEYAPAPEVAEKKMVGVLYDAYVSTDTTALLNAERGKREGEIQAKIYASAKEKPSVEVSSPAIESCDLSGEVALPIVPTEDVFPEEYSQIKEEFDKARAEMYEANSELVYSEDISFPPEYDDLKRDFDEARAEMYEANSYIPEGSDEYGDPCN